MHVKLMEGLNGGIKNVDFRLARKLLSRQLHYTKCEKLIPMTNRWKAIICFHTLYYLLFLCRNIWCCIAYFIIFVFKPHTMKSLSVLH